MTQIELEFDEAHITRRSPVRWTPEEDEKLIKLVNQQGLRYDSISRILNRPYGSISGRVNRLRQEGRVISRSLANKKQLPIEKVTTLVGLGCIVVLGVAVYFMQ